MFGQTKFYDEGLVALKSMIKFSSSLEEGVIQFLIYRWVVVDTPFVIICSKYLKLCIY